MKIVRESTGVTKFVKILKVYDVKKVESTTGKENFQKRRIDVEIDLNKKHPKVAKIFAVGEFCNSEQITSLKVGEIKAFTCYMIFTSYKDKKNRDVLSMDLHVHSINYANWQMVYEFAIDLCDLPNPEEHPEIARRLHYIRN